MWRKYSTDSQSFPEVVRKLKRSKFHQIATTLTKDDVKQKACVDYKLHALVYENATILKRIIEDQVRVKEVRKELNHKLSGVLEFLKSAYFSHLSETGTDPYHNIKFGLGHGRFARKEWTSTCRECNSVFKCVDEVRNGVVECTEPVKNILEAVKSKFELFMGHKVREAVQDERIKEMFEWTKEIDAGKRVVAFIDFKMKFMTERLRETQLQWYGKAGMSWHGSAVIYKPEQLREEPGSGNEHARFETRRVGNRGRGGQCAGGRERRRIGDSLSMFFVDHIAENDKRQDRVFTASIIEALCFRIKKELPCAEEISICSDNARYYNNNVLPLVLPLICNALDMKLQLFLHPDACCGKSCVDAHFAVSFRHLKRYITETEFDVLTPEDIVDALRYDGGVKNTVVDYIKVDRAHDKLMEYEFSSSCKLQASLGSPAQIRYEHLSPNRFELKTYRYSKCCYRIFHVDGAESTEINDPVHRKSVDWEEPPTHEEDENGVLKKVAGPPMASTVAKPRADLAQKIEAHRKGKSVRVAVPCDDQEVSLTEMEVDSTEKEASAFDVINERYGYGGSNSEMDIDDGEEPELHGIVNATQETLDLRDSRGQKRYYMFPVIAKGTVTGVEIKFMGHIRRYNRTTYIGTGNAFEDAEAEIRLTDENSTSEVGDGEPTGEMNENASGGTGSTPGAVTNDVGDAGRMSQRERSNEWRSDDGENGEGTRNGAEEGRCVVVTSTMVSTLERRGAVPTANLD